MLAMWVLAWTVRAQPRPTANARQVTSGDHFYTNPKFSPDQRYLAFSGPRYQGIYLLDLSTEAVTTLTDAPAAGYGFDWSPHEQTILARVASYDEKHRRDAVVVFDAATGGSRYLTEFRADMPAIPSWDNDGSNVLLYVDDTFEVLSVRNDDPGVRPTPVPLVGKTGLARVSADDQTLETLPIFSDRTVLNLTRSPDGLRIAFEVVGGNLYSANADGSGLVDLGKGHRPAWSPDGEWIVFMRAEDDGHTFTASDLFAVRSDGSDVVRLTDTPKRLEMNPDWSPDGAHIAYDDFTDGNIYVLPVSY